MGIFSKSLSKPNPLASSPSRRRPVEQRSGRSIPLGRLASGPVVEIPLARLSQHLVVTGSPGMGKTTLTAGLARRLSQEGLAVVVLEPAKSEYRWLLPSSSTVYGAAGQPGVTELKTNPFYVDAGVRIGAWIEDLTAAIADSYGAAQEATGPLYLEALVRRLYRACSIREHEPAGPCRQWPTVKTFLDQIDGFMAMECCSGPEVTGNIRGFLARRGRSMAACPALLCKEGLSFDDIISHGTTSILQLSDFGRGSARFLGMIMLLRVISSARILGNRPLHTVVVLEEAHSLFVDELSGEPTMFARLYEAALAELRAAGIGFVTVDQRPSLLPAGVMANSVSKVAFASTSGDDRNVIERALGLDEAQTRRFGGLSEGEALFSTAGIQGAEVIRADSRR